MKGLISIQYQYSSSVVPEVCSPLIVTRGSLDTILYWLLRSLLNFSYRNNVLLKIIEELFKLAVCLLRTTPFFLLVLQPIVVLYFAAL